MSSPAGRPGLRLGAFVGAVVAAGLGGLAAAAPGAAVDSAAPGGALAVLAGLVALCEHGAVGLGGGRSRTSVAVAPILAASFLLGAPGCLATALAFAVAAKAKARSPLHRMLFNFGNALLAALAAGWVLRLAAGPPAEAGLARLLPAAVLAGLAYYAVNHLLLSAARGLAEGRRPWAVWAADYRQLWPYYAVLGPLGLAAALGYGALGAAGLAAALLPAAPVHGALRRACRPRPARAALR